MKDILPSHWENPNGTRALMNRVYYKKDVDKLLERALVIDSWDDVWEIQDAILIIIKRVCHWAQSHKYFNDKVCYEKNIKTIKRLCFYWRRLKQIRINVTGG